jgi:hypothetical protein
MISRSKIVKSKKIKDSTEKLFRKRKLYKKKTNKKLRKLRKRKRRRTRRNRKYFSFGPEENNNTSFTNSQTKSNLGNNKSKTKKRKLRKRNMKKSITSRIFSWKNLRKRIRKNENKESPTDRKHSHSNFKNRDKHHSHRKYSDKNIKHNHTNYLNRDLRHSQSKYPHKDLKHKHNKLRKIIYEPISPVKFDFPQEPTQEKIKKSINKIFKIKARRKSRNHKRFDRKVRRNPDIFHQHSNFGIDDVNHKHKKLRNKDPTHYHKKFRNRDTHHSHSQSNLIKKDSKHRHKEKKKVSVWDDNYEDYNLYSSLFNSKNIRTARKQIKSDNSLNHQMQSQNPEKIQNLKKKNHKRIIDRNLTKDNSDKIPISTQ